jgi:hypothetical protein
VNDIDFPLLHQVPKISPNPVIKRVALMDLYIVNVGVCTPVDGKDPVTKIAKIADRNGESAAICLLGTKQNCLLRPSSRAPNAAEFQYPEHRPVPALRHIAS